MLYSYAYIYILHSYYHMKRSRESERERVSEGIIWNLLLLNSSWRTQTFNKRRQSFCVCADTKTRCHCVSLIENPHLAKYTSSFGRSVLTVLASFCVYF